MTDFFALFAASSALAAVLAAISIWSHRRVLAKIAALVATALFIPTIYLTYGDLLSRPKPVGLEWLHRDAPEATVLSARLREDEAIYLWVELPETNVPRAYRLPWIQELAKQLHGAQREAQAKGTKVQMRLPFKERTEDQEPVFYAQPQPPLPPKRAEQGPNRYFQHSSTGSPHREIGGS